MKNIPLIAIFFAVSLYAKVAAQDDTKDFTDHFHDEANIRDYIAKIDALIDASEPKIYASMEAESKGKDLPEAKTKNGIFMVYTFAHTEEGVLVHFSTSRAPYLPSLFGKNIVSLFMERSGWPKPSMFTISKNQVFHACWMVPDAEFAKVRAALPKLREEIRKEKNMQAVFLKAVLASKDLKEESNQRVQTTPTAVTPAAGQPARQP